MSYFSPIVNREVFTNAEIEDAKLELNSANTNQSKKYLAIILQLEAEIENLQLETIHTGDAL